MKRILVICDGMADIPVGALGGKTPLEAADTPGMDRMAKIGRSGLVQTVPSGFYPGSETAIMTILGCPSTCLPAGRGPLEAMGLGYIPGELAGRTVARYALKASGADVATLRCLHSGFLFHELSERSGIVITPEGSYSLPVTDDIAEFWSADVTRRFPSFGELHQTGGTMRPKGAVVGAVPLLAGIARAMDMEWIRPEGATGRCDTDFTAKRSGALDLIADHDFVAIHIEACDYASHALDPEAKTKAIADIDRHVISPLLRFAEEESETVSLTVMPDHPSLCSCGRHTEAPVPALLFYRGIVPDSVTAFSETLAAAGSIRTISDLYEE